MGCGSSQLQISTIAVLIVKSLFSFFTGTATLLASKTWLLIQPVVFVNEDGMGFWKIVAIIVDEHVPSYTLYWPDITTIVKKNTFFSLLCLQKHALITCGYYGDKTQIAHVFVCRFDCNAE